jgi:hypothetical protein
MLRGWAVDVIAGGVAVAAHDTIKKIEPTPHADEAFILGWAGESSIPTLVSYGNYAVPGTPAIITGNSLDRQGIDYLQSLARDKALELNAGHAQLAVTGTPLMDEVLMEGASAGSAKLLSAGVRLTSKVGRESTELALKTAREFANETAEAASKATQLLDNADSVPLEKVLDDAPKGTAQGLFGIADKPVPGLRNSALKDFYLDQVQSPEFAKRLTRYNWFAERLGVKTASVDEIVKALANNTTFHKTNGFFSAMYERANHGARAAFRIQGTTGKSIFARSTAWHEATHLGAALRGQSDKLFRGGLTHELLVQMTMSPELFGTVVGSTILVVGGTVIVLQ